MTTTEFSNEFDVLYNNIMSNAAPGLNEYEKSVFLTKSQDEIIYNYFNPNGNKYKEGFDDSAKRQMDFQELIRYSGLECRGVVGTPASGTLIIRTNDLSFQYKIIVDLEATASTISYNPVGKIITFTTNWAENQDSMQYIFNDFIYTYSPNSIITLDGGGPPTGTPTSMATPAYLAPYSGYDSRSIIYYLPVDISGYPEILLPINESVTAVTFLGATLTKQLYQVVPIKFDEYQRLMNKPFKEPLKNQMWRLIGDSTNDSVVELIPHSGDIVETYKVRYVKRPNPIILTNLSGVYSGLTINGKSAVTQCELNPIIHRAILDRAVELAKAAYVGDLKSTVELNSRNE